MVLQTPPPESRRRKAAVGFEPTNTGVAHQRLGPLGYAAGWFLVLFAIPFPLEVHVVPFIPYFSTYFIKGI